jgi:drug/metabolite transporter (DMT)-like permease
VNYLLILGAALLFTCQVLFFKEFNKKYMKNLANYFLFDFLYFSLVVIIMIVASNGIHHIHAPTVYFGIAFGIVTIIANLSYIKAMECGPLSFSTLFFAFGILIPTLAGPVFWNEQMSFIQIGGFLLLLITFYIINSPTAGENKKINIKWLIFSLIAFVSNGGLMIFMKTQQVMLPGKETKEFLIISFATSSLLSILFFLWYKFRNKREAVISHMKGSYFWLVVLCTGVTTAFGNLIGMILAGRIPAVIQFPSINGGIIIFTSILSAIIYKENINKKGVLGLSSGIIAIILLSFK